MVAGIILVIGVMCLIGSVVIFFQREDGQALQFVNEVKFIKGELPKYASQKDLDDVRMTATYAKGAVATAVDQCQGIVNDRMKKNDEELEALKTRVANMQGQVNGHHNALKSPQSKVVHVNHSYTPPIQVDLNYPEAAPKMKPKGRGQKSLLERSMSR